MTLKMVQAVNAAQLYSKLKDSNPPIKTLYKLSKLFTALNHEYEFYRTNLTQIIETYGLKDENGAFLKTEDGNGIRIGADNITAAQDAIQNLMDLDVELPDIKFTLEELSNITLTVDEFNNLLPFIAE